MKKTTSGFTIVELLIVIVVIGILAVISIVAYTGITNKTNDSVVLADLDTIAKKMEIARIELGHYPQSLAEFPALKLTKDAYTTAENNVYYIVRRDTDQYAFGVKPKPSLPSGYIMTNTGITQAPSVYGANTAAAIGTTWGDDSNRFTVLGYNGGTGLWAINWQWTN